MAGLSSLTAQRQSLNFSQKQLLVFGKAGDGNASGTFSEEHTGGVIIRRNNLRRTDHSRSVLCRRDVKERERKNISNLSLFAIKLTISEIPLMRG